MDIYRLKNLCYYFARTQTPLLEIVMNIMIFDDASFHRVMAKRLLKGHDLTIFGDYEGVLDALSWGQHRFDVVLTDLMVPSFPHNLNRVTEEMSVGTTIALLAIAKGIKNVAIVTDVDHDYHRGVQATNWLKPFTHIGGSNFRCVHKAVSLYDNETLEEVTMDYLRTDEGKQKYPQILSEDRNRILSWRGLVRGKRWDWALKYFLPQS